MKNLLSYIKKIPQDRVAFIFENKKITYYDIVQVYDKNKSIIDNLKGSSLVLRGINRYQFSLLLILLDGDVSNILFLPSDIDDDIANRYIEELGINYSVTIKDNKLSYSTIKKNHNTTNITTTNWIIPTSGTTAVPKLIFHTLKSLTKTTKINIKEGAEFIWGLVFDIYRFSGIQVYLQSLLSGSTLIISDENDTISDILELFLKYKSNTISATPTFYIKALMFDNFKQLNLKNITLGGEIVTQPILNRLGQVFKNAKIRHIYASTEVGVGFSVSDRKEGFPLDYLTNGINGITLKIDENNILLIKNKDQFINTDDLVKVKENRVYFLGRNSGAINVGGNKVIPEEVERIILNYPLVQNTYVYAKKSNITGSLVCADVVLKSSDLDIKDIKKDIIKYCKNYLELFKVPVLLKVVDDISITKSCKIKRG